MNTQPMPAPPLIKKQRPWWFYALISLGGLAVFGVVAVVVLLLGGFLVAKSMVHTYTTTTPRIVAKTHYDPKTAKQLQKELQNKWADFGKAVMRHEAPAPFKISADDINLFLGQQQPFRDHVRFVITNNLIQAEFAAPLGQSGWKELKGRYLSGTANINLVFQDGWLTVTLGKVEANGKIIPGWALTKLRGQNFLGQLDRNHNFTSLMQEIESIEVKDEFIVVTPMK